jgi:hypothetical protein
MYGNTHVVARSIADGLRATHEVTLVPVAKATEELVGVADLLVAGGPTHMHGMTSASSRRMAAESAHKEGSELTMDPDADGPGMRGWLSGLSTRHALAAAYDTRLTGLPAFTGRASRGISRGLKRHGYRMIVKSESFLISKQNRLMDGEAARARSWGAALGVAARDAKELAGFRGGR